MIELSAFSAAAAQSSCLQIKDDEHGMPIIQAASQTFKEKVLHALSYVPILKNLDAVTEYATWYSKQVETDNAQVMGVFLQALSKEYGSELTDRAVTSFNVDLSGKTPLSSRTVSQIINQVESMHGPSRARMMNASKMTGFHNLGNTCYANSALKVLIHSMGEERLMSHLKHVTETSTDQIQKDVAEKLKVIIAATFTEQKPLHHQLNEFFASLQKTELFAKRKDDGTLQHPIIGEQMDAPEFLMRMLDILNLSDIAGDSMGQTMTKVQGNEEVFSSKEASYCHQVYARDFSHTLQQIVDESTKDELLEGRFRENDLENTTYTRTKQWNIADLSTLERFTIQINSAIFDEANIKMRKVPLPNANFSGDITIVVHDEKTDENWTVTFEPREAIVQRGEVDSGHYIAYTKDGENGWVCHDDSDVKDKPAGIAENDQPMTISYSVKDKVMLFAQEPTIVDNAPAAKNQPRVPA